MKDTVLWTSTVTETDYSLKDSVLKKEKRKNPNPSIRAFQKYYTLIYPLSEALVLPMLPLTCSKFWFWLKVFLTWRSLSWLFLFVGGFGCLSVVLFSSIICCICVKSCLSRDAVSGEDARTDPPALPQTAVFGGQKEISKGQGEEDSPDQGFKEGHGVT